MSSTKNEALLSLQILEPIYGKLTEGQAAIYAEKLMRYTVSVQRRAIDEVIETHRSRGFPSIAEILEACRKSDGSTAGVSTSDGVKELTERMNKANRLASEWVMEKFFRNKGELVRQAESEDWVDFFRAYADAVAWVQAQILCNVQNRGWDAITCIGKMSTPDEQREFWQAQEKACAGGAINVTVSRERIAEWQNLAALRNAAPVYPERRHIKNPLGSAA